MRVLQLLLAGLLCASTAVAGPSISLPESDTLLFSRVSPYALR